MTRDQITSAIFGFILHREADHLRLQWLHAVHEDRWTGTTEDSYRAWLKTYAGAGENLGRALRLLGWSLLSVFAAPLFRRLAANRYGSHPDYRSEWRP